MHIYEYFPIMSSMSKGWTEERRKKQAETIRKNRPWEKSTGPKTAKGKKRSSYNALKHGGRSQNMEYARQMLRLNSEFIKMTKLCFKSDEYITIRLALKQKRRAIELKENGLKTDS